MMGFGWSIWVLLMSFTAKGRIGRRKLWQGGGHELEFGCFKFKMCIRHQIEGVN